VVVDVVVVSAGRRRGAGREVKNVVAADRQK
jgi:hypothetical protein